MQIESLKVYCDLVETESFTVAAHINGVTQSAVSQQISSMELLFASQLVERSKKRFRLTREGQVVYDHSKQIIQSYEALHAQLQELKQLVSGTIRVAAIYSIGLHTLPPYLKRFLKAHPSVNVHVEYRHAYQIYQDVLSNIVDLGLVAFPRKDHHVETVPWGRDPMVLVCHPQHPLAKSKAVKVQATAHHKFVAFASQIPTRQATDKFLKAHGVTVHPVMEFDNIDTLKRAVEIDAGVAIVPQSTLVQEVAQQSLVQVPFDNAEFFRQMAILYKRNKTLSPAVKQFITTLKGG